MQTTIQDLSRIESRLDSVLLESNASDRRAAYGKGRTIVDDFIRSWSRILQVAPFSFECNIDEAAYITRPKDAIPVYDAIAVALGTTCHTFIDAFACVGGDTLAAMNQFRQAEVYSIQINTGINAERFKRLINNVNTFQRITRRGGATVQAVGMDIGSFIQTYNVEKEISVLFLDPPWALGRNPSEQSSINDIYIFLNTNIWSHLIKQGLFPILIVLKLPMQTDEIHKWPFLQSYYRLQRILTPRNKFCVHIFRYVDPVQKE